MDNQPNDNQPNPEVNREVNLILDELEYRRTTDPQELLRVRKAIIHLIADRLYPDRPTTERN